jgi:tetratricopeptide (TPR) repeat protein
MTHMRRSPRFLSLLAALAGLAALAALSLAGCAKQPREAAGRLDTPQHHTLRGYDAIDAGDWKEAGREFDLAISLGKDYGPAYGGKALVVAHEADPRTMPESQRMRILARAEALLNDADEKAKNDDESRAYHIAAIRVYRQVKPPNYVNRAESHYVKAQHLDPKGTDPQPDFYMARVYRDAFQLNKAQNLYTKVLGMNTPMTGKADAELALVQKVIRAEPGTPYGKTIAFDDSVTRADLAALFVEELKLERLYQRGGQAPDTSFKPPAGQQSFQADRMEKAPEATDVSDHPLRSDIEEVLKLRVAGLQPDPAHQFHPNATVLRGEFAMMVEDILVKVTGEKGLKTKFIGQPSPFRDVRSDVPWFNAIQVVTTRSLMEPKDKVNGIFKPGDPITGADALLVIRLLKDELRSYLRS